ncbi:hypothetical protein MMC13_001315 [Lambiella insularis]|nr:hypothetical protein [Lambiella insularis]
MAADRSKSVGEVVTRQQPPKMKLAKDFPVVPKLEDLQEGFLSLTESSLEPNMDGAKVPESGQVQNMKRKGGRKPLCATSEERKQKNRQCQAVFRERRTAYTKQLEDKIKHQGETLQNVQQSHCSTVDECLMLRYRNSLLERILLESGIDVQAELESEEKPTQLVIPPRSFTQLIQEQAPSTIDINALTKPCPAIRLSYSPCLRQKQ